WCGRWGARRCRRRVGERLPQLPAAGGGVGGREEERAADIGEFAERAVAQGVDVPDERRAGIRAVGRPQLFAVGAPALWSVNSAEEHIASDCGQIGDVASTGGADVLDERGAGTGSIRPPKLGIVGGAVLGTVIGAEEERAAQVGQ